MQHALKKEKCNPPRFKTFQMKKVHQILVWKVIKPLKVRVHKMEMENNGNTRFKSIYFQLFLD